MVQDNLEILLEDIRGKFDLVLEGHEVLRKEIRDTRHELCEKIESVDFKVEALNHKVDAVAVETNGNTTAIRDLAAETRDNTVAIRDLSAKLDGVAPDLSAHRADTEARKEYARGEVRRGTVDDLMLESAQ
jgi:outer membrane murein-binding lipoprotein Lpp